MASNASLKRSDARITGEDAGREWRDRYADPRQLARLRDHRRELFDTPGVAFAESVVRVVLGGELRASQDVPEFWAQLGIDPRRCHVIVDREFASGFVAAAVEFA